MTKIMTEGFPKTGGTGKQPIKPKPNINPPSQKPKEKI